MRNLTKDSRQQSRDYQFKHLIEQGYTQETYKGLDFFAQQDGKYFTLKVFKGTGANHIHFMNYRTEDSRNKAVEQFKQGHDRQETYKAEQKEKYKGQKSRHAAAAAAIRSELKAAFPSVKFSATSDSFAGGDSVHIEWTDGPTTEQVKNISGKYQYGHFNGMEDIYEYTNSREDIPQAKYVQEQRTMSKETEETIKNNLLQQYGAGFFEQLESYEISRRIYQEFAQTDFCPKQEQPQPTEQTESNPDKIQLVDYSEKAFAVTGNFSAHYDNLIKLGGKYNKFLKCGRGIIFSKTKFEDVKAYLIANKQQQPQETTEAQPEQTEEPAATLHTSPNLPTPKTAVFQLESFKILWHEGKQNPDYTGATFTTWEEVQTAFLNIWEVNEKGQDGGYTKVKCEMKFKDMELITNRIDITNRIKNGDFNPSDEHIVSYLQSIADETEQEQPQPQQYNSLPEITTAANTGKLISLYNLSQLVNQ